MEFNRHHVWHERKWYRSGLDKDFRTYPGFVITMPVQDHKELHAAINPPIKPSPMLMHIVLDALRRDNVDLTDTIPATLEVLATQAERSYNGDSQLIKRIGANLLAQSEFIVVPLSDVPVNQP